MMTTRSSRQEPLKWGAGGRGGGGKLWQTPKCSRRQHIKVGKKKERILRSHTANDSVVLIIDGKKQ